MKNSSLSIVSFKQLSANIEGFKKQSSQSFFRRYVIKLNTYITLGFAVLSSSFVLAKGTVTSLTVENNVLFFQLSPPYSPSINCVANENHSIWAVSLDTPNGKTIRNLLHTASSFGKPVEVVSGGDCYDKEGYERPARVKLLLK